MDQHQQVVEDLVNDGLCHAASFFSTTTASPPRRRRQRPLPLESPSIAASCNSLDAPLVRSLSDPPAVSASSHLHQRPLAALSPYHGGVDEGIYGTPPIVRRHSNDAGASPCKPIRLVRAPSAPPAVAPPSPAHPLQPEGAPSGRSPHAHLLLAVAMAKR
ncbi:hypothetical protein T484DRAFT_1754558 [Baffinella frigidus]|nr:hypothetical protein T484DRAFT_1754558 [Cryptophyta sp. CCMP2293]